MRSLFRAFALVVSLAIGSIAASAAAQAVSPLLNPTHPVDWWFAYKFNASDAGLGSDPADAHRQCLFGGTLRTTGSISQRYILASSDNPALQDGGDFLGMWETDPLGATFAVIRARRLHYVIWNDQFYQDPAHVHCSGDSCGAPWAHSKGVLAWDEHGEGFVLQVTTPSWPRAGGDIDPNPPATALGNTLGCIRRPNNIINAQHFFALRLSHDDVAAVARGLVRASVNTDPQNAQLVNSGGPYDIVREVDRMGVISGSAQMLDVTLSTGVRLIVKPARLHAPPWQLVSSVLDNEPLRTATWWEGGDYIPTTEADFRFTCWPESRPPPGRVEVATSGDWNGRIRLTGAPNHAKIGVSLAGGHDYVIFGDMNQDGELFVRSDCGDSQNGRGGLFFVVQNAQLATDVRRLIGGETAALPICQANGRRCTRAPYAARLNP